MVETLPIVSGREKRGGGGDSQPTSRIVVVHPRVNSNTTGAGNIGPQLTYVFILNPNPDSLGHSSPFTSKCPEVKKFSEFIYPLT